MEQTEFKQKIGIVGATFTLIGFIVSVPIFVLPGELGATAGPGLFISFIIAGVLAALSCVAAAQIGGMYPMSGAGYIAVSRIISPFWGFMLVWMIMVCLVVGMPVLGFGFADYLEMFIPGLPRRLVAGAAIGLFGSINLLGVKAAVSVQALMVALVLAVLLTVGIGGVWHLKPELMTPLLPNGFLPIITAAIPAYFCYAGFMVIVEMGDEIENPARTIPWSLALSFLAILLIYVLVSLAVPGTIPWQTLGGGKAPLARAAETFLPAWFGKFIGLSALFAAGTAINAWFMTQTRDIFALARDRVLPVSLAHLSPRFGEPDAAIIFAIALAISGVLIGATNEEYAIMVVLALMLVQMGAGLVILLAPSRAPERFRMASFKLGTFGRWFSGLGFILLSAGFAVVGVIQSRKAAAIFAALVGVGSIYYFLRKHHLRKSGHALEEALRKGA